MVDFSWRPNGLDPEQRIKFSEDLQFGYLDKQIRSNKTRSPEVVFNEADSTMLRALRTNLNKCRSFVFSVAFVSPRALALLKQELAEFSGHGTIITSDYLGFNSPEAFSELLALTEPNPLRQGQIDVRIHKRNDFHPKGYVFTYPDDVTAYMGSSNMTESALVSNREWNIKVSAAHESDLASQINLLTGSELLESEPLTQEWIDAYKLRYRRPEPSVYNRSTPPTIHADPTQNEVGVGNEILPNAMQQEALIAIESSRAAHQSKALVISATGTGKTILAALHVKLVNPSRMLFVVHREQILDKAIQEFKRVLKRPDHEFGKLSGTSKDLGARYLFATVQSLSRSESLAEFSPEAFDYILIDEVHRAGAKSYQRLMQHFIPNFWLGVTATPERTDGINIYEMFDFNVPYEIRLNKALESDMLAPFHYYGVADVITDDGTRIGSEENIGRLTSGPRVNHILDALKFYGQAGVDPRGLVFCSSKAEARELSKQLNSRTLRGRTLRTVALTGEDPIEYRNMVVSELESGDLDYILTVDIFNEGVDIPSVNQVVMLRQTESAIIFVQQLGRGLRKFPTKEYVVVIDFIGNYANNYLIPVALFGDVSLNKESLRQQLISAEERGVLPGLSSVRFDRISQERVLQAIVDVKLDSMANLKAAYSSLHDRLGRHPRLLDFWEANSVDPVVLGTRYSNYDALASKFNKMIPEFTGLEDRALTFLSQEVLAAKRPHEAAILQLLIAKSRLSLAEIPRELERQGVPATSDQVASVARIFSLEFSTDTERKKYVEPIASIEGDQLVLDPRFAKAFAVSEAFSSSVSDLLATARKVTEANQESAAPFIVGSQYSRKDVCRLLNWRGNYTSTVYGYKVDTETATCPIFVTLHKSDDVSASTAYGDALVDQSTLHWFTRSRRTLESGEVKAIAEGDVALHVFVKKDDSEGTGFFYLGEAESRNAFDSKMPSDPSIKVVQMDLVFDTPIPAATYDYFRPAISAG